MSHQPQHSNANKRFCKLLLKPLLLACLLSSVTQAAQYRSKVYLDPDLQLGESVTQTLEELENQFATLDDDYAKASAGRQIAAQYLREKKYDKAAEYYEKVLSSGGLSAIVNQDILKQLAAIYLRLDQAEKALTSLDRLNLLKTITAPDALLLLAQAQFKLKQHLAVNRTLEKIIVHRKKLKRNQLRQLLALYYQTGNYEQSTELLQQLLKSDPSDVDSWRQLTSLYLAQNKKRQALNQLSLAKSKNVPFRSKDWILLSDLYAANKYADKAARVLQQAIETGQVKGEADNYRRLFESWLRAREPQKASAALKIAAKLSADPELYLHLAQLQMDRQQWQAMNQTINSVCEQTLADKYVGRANLLLGISRFKLKDKAGARRALINATLIGSNPKAVQWLRFMQAEPATASELRRISAPCQPEDTNTGNMVARANGGIETAQSADALVFDYKTIAKQKMFVSKHRLPTNEVISKIETLAIKLAMSLVKGGGSINGPFIMTTRHAEKQSEMLDFTLAFPFKGRPRNSGRYRIKETPKFDCVSTTYQGPNDGLEQAWLALYQELSESGQTTTGEQRMLWADDESNDKGEYKVELQLGIQAQ